MATAGCFAWLWWLLSRYHSMKCYMYLWQMPHLLFPSQRSSQLLWQTVLLVWSKYAVDTWLAITPPLLINKSTNSWSQFPSQGVASCRSMHTLWISCPDWMKLECLQIMSCVEDRNFLCTQTSHCKVLCIVRVIWTTLGSGGALEIEDSNIVSLSVYRCHPDSDCDNSAFKQSNWEQGWSCLFDVMLAWELLVLAAVCVAPWVYSWVLVLFCLNWYTGVSSGFFILFTCQHNKVLILQDIGNYLSGVCFLLFFHLCSAHSGQ